MPDFTPFVYCPGGALTAVSKIWTFWETPRRGNRVALVDESAWSSYPARVEERTWNTWGILG